MTGQPWSAVITTPLPGWRFALRCGEAGVEEAEFLPAVTPLQPPASDCARRAVAEVQRFLAAGRHPFTVTLDLRGTPFQQRVWQALRAIPPGQPCSYGALARRLGSSARAVAAACRANPVALFIPCHRVVAAHGLGGYMGALDGAPVKLKQWLLDHESAG